MALFKIEKGLAANLTSNRKNTVEGYCYFTTDDGKFYIDIATGSDLSKRVCLNAYKADKLNCGQIGSSTNPVYFSSEGVPVATTYKLNTTVPANALFTDTTYAFTTGDNNGEIKITPSGSSAFNVAIKGLNTAAYVSSATFAPATHTHSYVAKSGDTMTGNLMMKGSNPYVGFQTTSGSTKGYVQYVASSDVYGIGAGISNSLVITSTGSIQIPKSQSFTPATGGTGTIGTSNSVWQSMYATTFIGNLSGTATKVSKNLTIGSKTYNGSSAVSISASDLGLAQALKFVGSVSFLPSTTSNYSIGDVILVGKKEYACTASNTWTELGDESSFAYKTVKIKAGNGLTIASGGDLSADTTIALPSVGTAGTYGPTEDVNGTDGSTIAIPQITTDSYGRVTSVTNRTYTSKDTNTVSSVNGKTGAVSLTHSDIGALNKLTYEWNKEYSAGGTPGYLLIGSFPMYDTNVTIDIDATTNTTYHGTVVIATQNVTASSIGTAHVITVYGDPTGTISDAIRVTWASGSRNYNVYFVPSTWSKNLIHIRAIGQYMNEIDTTKICTRFTAGTAPATTRGLTVVNALKSNFNNFTYTHPTTSGNKHIPAGGSSGQILRWSADGTAAWGDDNNTIYTLGSFGITATAAELNYTDGVTSNIQTQLNNKLPLSGGTVTGNILFSNSSGQSGQPNLKWKTIKNNEKKDRTPFIGYCTASSDGTFMVGSLEGTSYTTGLAIGGSSGNLLWKGKTIATTDQIPTNYAKTNAANSFSASNTFNSTTTFKGNIILNSALYGASLPSSTTGGQLYFMEDNSPSLPSGGATNQILVSDASGNAKWHSVAKSTDTSKRYLVNTGSSSGLDYIESVYTQDNVLFGAAWNDYAEFRTQKEIIEPGYCVASNDNGQVYKTTEKYQACDGIVSDTYGFAIGETEKSNTPLAVAGRVLAYFEGNREDYHAGDTVCAGPNGKICKMTREEIREWPDRIIGIVSEIPQYETWGENNIKVNNRIWIKIK